MNPPKMPIHIGDYMRDTGHLRAAQHGAYLLLLFHYWSTGKLPHDDDQLAAIARMSRTEWKRTRPILECFFDDGWHHGRVEKDLEAARESYEKRAKAGEKGGKAKAEAKQSSSIATAGPQQPLTLDHLPEEKIKRADARGDENVSRDTLPVESPTGQPSKYAFEGAIVRLTQKHFDEWQRAFSALDLRAELMARDAWLERASEADRNNWFISTSKYLANRNMEAKSKQKNFKWASGIEGVY